MPHFLRSGAKAGGEMGGEAFLRSGKVNRAVILQPIEKKELFRFFREDEVEISFWYGPGTGFAKIV
jgi:hypothetical protein